MDFDLSADQLELRDAAGALLDDLASPARVRKVVDSGAGHDPDLWQAVVDQGWLAVAVPEDQGGLGLGVVELAVLAEQVGAHVAPLDLIGPATAATTLARCAASGSAVAADRLADVLSGTTGICLAGDGISGAPAPVEVVGDTLSGRLGPAIGAPGATLALVAADGRLWLVELDEPVAAEPAMDRTRLVGWLDLAGRRATEIGDGSELARAVDVGAALGCAELLGASQRMLDLTVEYAKERQQFGRPIGSFQAVKHRCADMLVDVEGMRSAAWYAAWCAGVGDAERPIAVSTAKVWCGDASRRVMASGLQVHGGIGFTWEHDVHLYLKRSHLTALAFGSTDEHRRRLLRLLRAKVAAGESVV